MAGRLRVRLRTSRLPWLSLGLVAIVVGATLGAFFLAQDLKAQSQREALLRRATNTADALENQAGQASDVLKLSSLAAQAANGEPGRFEELMAGRVGDESVANVSLVELDDGRRHRLRMSATKRRSSCTS
jgi:hypothetical protein